MGGKIFNKKRFSKEKYENVKKSLTKQIKEKGLGKFIGYKFVESYRNKDSFGDIDILYCVKPFDNIIPPFLFNRLFNIKDIELTSDNDFSALYNGVQVDFIYCDEEWCFDFMSNILNYDPFCNILSSILKQFNLKLNNKGLSYVGVVDKDHNLRKEIHLTLDFDEVLKLLELNTEVYKKGFYNYTDIFDYILTSPYFRKEYFDLENMTSMNRRRAKKRPLFMKFLEYIKDKETLPYKTLNQQKIDSFFPVANVNEKMNREIRKQEMIKERSEYKKYFNGHVIMECIKDINVKEIDPFKEFIIKMFCNEEIFINFVMQLKGNTLIKEYVPIWYKQFKANKNKKNG